MNPVRAFLWFVLALPIGAMAQNPLQPLLRPDGTVKLPTTIAAIKTALGRNHSAFEKEDFNSNPGGWGNRYIWQFPNGLILTAQSDGQTAKPNPADPVRAFFLAAPAGRPTAAVRQFVLNQTTLSDCRTRFGKQLRPDRVFDRRGYVLAEPGQFLYLFFDAKNRLIGIWQTTFSLGTAG